MGFERFDKAAAVAVTKPPRVSVSAAGVFSLTWKAFEMLGAPDYVEFFFDRERRVIAIAAAGDQANAYQVRRPRTDDRGAVSFRGETFLKYYGIDFSSVWRRTPWMEAPYLCISVDEPVEERHGAEDLEKDVVE